MNEVFSRRLRECRERLGIPSSTLGELVGLSKNCIGRYERGERIPSVTVAVALADFFECSLDWLLGTRI